MIPTFTDEPVVTFTRFARDWFRLLARGDYAGAVARLDEPNCYGQRWDAETIQSVFRDYARCEAVRIADPDTIAGDGRPNLGEFTEGSGYWFDHDVPLNGGWSDLTVQFEFLRRPNGYAVVLQNIHVL